MLTTPLLRALRAAHPDAAITFVTKAHYAPLLVHDPAVTRVVSLLPGEPVRQLARRLEPAYNCCLDLHRSLRSLALRALVRGRWTSYGKRRLARAAAIHWGRLPRGTVSTAERYFDAVRDLGIVPDGAPARVHWTDDHAARAASLAPAGAVVLAPGARHESKRWPAPHWRAVAARLQSAGVPVVATGTSAERPLLEGAGVIDTFGVELPVIAALMARSRVVVANDSGLLHLATASGAPVVGLFGPTVRAFGFHPYRARGTVLERALPCRPCSAHGGAACPLGHQRCLADIAPDAVLSAILAA